MSLKELSKYTITSKYAAYIPELKRRETWTETVHRCRDMHLRKYEFLIQPDKDKINEVFEAVVRKECAPSMRSLQFGGAAIERKNARLYNCCVAHIHNSRSLEKAFWLLLCGCGVGLGLTRKYTERFPKLITQLYVDVPDYTITYVIPDTIEGWAQSIKALVDSYTEGNEFSGKQIIFDYSKIRQKGSQLSIGGKAPGSDGLRQCHKKVTNLLLDRIKSGNRKLRSIDLYDIAMHCSDAVLSGGIRRSATIALFDLHDELMMNAKTPLEVQDYCGNFVDGRYIGKVKYKDRWREVILSTYEAEQLIKTKKLSWITLEPQRGRSNNSVLLDRKYINSEEFYSIFSSTRHFGEPGFVFVDNEDSLYNPCAEIGFIPIVDDEPAVQFCNLSIVNGNKVRTKADFMKAVEYATIIGTLQAGYTDFDFLDERDKKITEEEVLLGVSVLGFLANPEILTDNDILKEASALALKVNEEWAAKLGINKAARVTCVKPDGNSAAALESPFSGIHPAHSKKYYRRVQANKDENLYQHFSMYNSYLCEPSVYSENNTDDVITFPIEVENGAVFKDNLTAIEHLELIKTVQENWVKGGQRDNTKPISNSVSCTVLVKDDEWNDVARYIFKNRDYFATVSLLSNNGDKVYAQAPYESVSDDSELEKFNKLREKFIPVDYSLLVEEDDHTARSEEAACAGGLCSL